MKLYRFFSALIILDILVLIDTRFSPCVISPLVKEMVIGPAGAALIAGAIAATASIWSAKSASDTNAANAQSTERINQANIIAAQNANAIARMQANQDYDRMNSYNSPLQQMQRFREGGLSPHLAYSSGAAGTASAIRATDPKVPRMDASHMAPVDFSNIGESVQSGLSQYMNIRQQDVDLELKKKQSDLLDQESRKREIDMVGRITKNDQSAYNLGVQKELRDSTVEAAHAKALNETYKSQNLLRSNMLLQQKYDLNEIQAHKLTTEIAGVTVQTQLRQLELDMLKSGRSKSDPYYIRAMRNIADVISQKTGVDVSVVADVLSAGKGVKVPKSGPSKKPTIKNNWDATTPFMNKFK